jgi:hypothetical protein
MGKVTRYTEEVPANADLPFLIRRFPRTPFPDPEMHKSDMATNRQGGSDCRSYALSFSIWALAVAILRAG